MNDYVKKTLSNGIRVYFYKDKNMKRFFASYNVGYGTNGYYDKFYYRDKPYHVNPAIAHFLEHMLIETSPNGNMLLKYMDENYDTNGSTYPEVTSYYFVAIDSEEKTKNALKELIEMVERPVFTEENIEKVKHAIVEELKRTGDNIYQVARSANRHNTYKNYDPVPVNNNVLGSIETTNAITLEEAKVCYDAYYSDENKFLVIGGNIDIDDYVKYLESIFKDIPQHKNELKEYNYSDEMDTRTDREVLNLPTDADYCLVTYKIKNDFNIDLLKLDLYLHFYLSLKLDTSTKFIEELVKNNYIIRNISYAADFFKGVIAITFAFNSYNVDDALDALDKELNMVGLDKEEFELLKREMIAGEIRRQDNIYKQLGRFPLAIDFTEHISDIDLIKSITYEEMIEVISKFEFNTKTTTVVKDLSKLEQKS